MAATAWFGGGAPFGGSTLGLQRPVPVFFSLLGGALRSRFPFLAGAPTPTPMCLLLPCPRGLTSRLTLCLSARLTGHAARGGFGVGPGSRSLWRGACEGFGSPFGAEWSSFFVCTTFVRSAVCWPLRYEPCRGLRSFARAPRRRGGGGRPFSGGACGGTRPLLRALRFGCGTRVPRAELVKCQSLRTAPDTGRRFSTSSFRWSRERDVTVCTPSRPLFLSVTRRSCGVLALSLG